VILVEKPVHQPARCAVLGRGEDAEGFIDTGSHINCIDPHVYVSVGAVKLMAQKIGLALQEEQKELQSQVTLLAAENELLKSQIADANKELDAIAILEPRFKSKKKPGRPKKVEVAA
jgi:hypothetical protein